MRIHSIVALALALAGLLPWCVAIGADSGPPPQSPATPGDAPAQMFAPGFADLMLMWVQPRHLKLYYAGTRNNWELAAFEMRSLRQSFARAARTIPNYQGSDVAHTVAAIMEPSMKAMDAAVVAGDSGQFVKAYDELTQSCNACHAYMEHPFIAVKVPTGEAQFPGQQFDPGP